MRKVLAVFLFIFLLGLTFFIVVRYYSNAQSSDNWFNNRYRSSFAVSPILRSVFNLVWDGDAKTDFLLDDRFSKIKLEVDQYDHCQLTLDMLKPAVEEIESVLGKTGGVEIVMSDTLPLIKDGYTSQEIRALTDAHQNFSPAGDTTALYLLCINNYNDQPSNIGHTVHEDGIVLFWEALQKTSAGNAKIMQSLVTSTVLHEFGHQIGLDHVTSSRCIMAAAVETPGSSQGIAPLIPTRFCDEEIGVLEEIRSGLYNK